MQIEDYLQQKLYCDRVLIDYLLTKYPSLQTKSLKQIEEIIDLFKEFEISPIRLITSPQFFDRDSSLIRMKFEYLKENGLNINRILSYTLMNNEKFKREVAKQLKQV